MQHFPSCTEQSAHTLVATSDQGSGCTGAYLSVGVRAGVKRAQRCFARPALLTACRYLMSASFSTTCLSAQVANPVQLLTLHSARGCRKVAPRVPLPCLLLRSPLRPSTTRDAGLLCSRGSILQARHKFFVFHLSELADRLKGAPLFATPGSMLFIAVY